jgi:hypothetical protein
VASWTVADVGKWLEKMELADCKSSFAGAKINGAALLELSIEEMKDELNIPLGYRKLIAKALREIQKK